MCDSLDILEYLEKTYPDRPTLFPNNTKGLHLAFQEGIMHTGFAALFPFIIPAEVPAFSPRSKEYFCRTRFESFGVPVEELAPKGEEAVKEWVKFKAGLEILSKWYEVTDDAGPFLMGNILGWGDIAMASWIIWIKAIYENDQKWKDIAGWSGGRWVKLLEAVEPYTRVD
ncbi:hypothetical protein BJ165DRAFT_367820 [Panaeolus papilionaceus]|nr:hypothetical protein BJ165DRAFT_367820 [Panaeolus papilionaceus]